jgi:hypothetical protein
MASSVCGDTTLTLFVESGWVGIGTRVESDDWKVTMIHTISISTETACWAVVQLEQRKPRSHTELKLRHSADQRFDLSRYQVMSEPE